MKNISYIRHRVYSSSAQPSLYPLSKALLKLGDFYYRFNTIYDRKITTYSILTKTFESLLVFVSQLHPVSLTAVHNTFGGSDGSCISKKIFDVDMLPLNRWICQCRPTTLESSLLDESQWILCEGSAFQDFKGHNGLKP